MLYDEVKPKLKFKKGIYKPLEDSRMLARCIEKYGFGKMLDLGTGSGILGIVGALKGLDVTFADVNSDAVECAKENAAINGVKGNFVVSNVFSNIEGKFNIIVFNAPFLRSRPISTGKIKVSMDGGRKGREIIDLFLAEYKKHVLDEHLVFMTESWWNGFKDDVVRLNAEIPERKHYPLLGDCVVLKFK
ncbi:MAG: HemK2/MTQ2 family protein methyltransferase [Candidatus Micrarchaeaceae archaeon]|jgi:release factor glutamine methyltransferase